MWWWLQKSKRGLNFYSLSWNVLSCDLFTHQDRCVALADYQVSSPYNKTEVSETFKKKEGRKRNAAQKQSCNNLPSICLHRGWGMVKAGLELAESGVSLGFWVQPFLTLEKAFFFALRKTVFWIIFFLPHCLSVSISAGPYPSPPPAPAPRFSV